MFTGEHSWTACSTAACGEVHGETGVSEPLLTIRLGLPACCLPERESVCPYSNLSVRLRERNVSLRPATPANLIRCFIVTRLNAFERRQIQMD